MCRGPIDDLGMRAQGIRSLKWSAYSQLSIKSASLQCLSVNCPIRTLMRIVILIALRCPQYSRSVDIKTSLLYGAVWLRYNNRIWIYTMYLNIYKRVAG